MCSVLRICIVATCAGVVLECANRDALAQQVDRSVASSSLAALTSQVPAGEIVYVTDAAGSIVHGKLAEMTNDVLQLRVGDVTRIQWQKRDSPLTGVVIGGAVGAVHGIYWLIADPNECTGLCAEDYVAIGVGALVGGLIDRAIKKKVTVYEASSRKSTKVDISPLLVGDRRGLQVAVTF
jgi:hypothetical protein